MDASGNGARGGNMDSLPSVERRLTHLLLGIAAVAILGVLAILPYRLYERDIRHASVEASRLSSVVHVALSEALAQGADVTELINRFQGISNVDIRLTRLQPGDIHPGEATGKASSRLSGTDLDYLAPPILDRAGHTWLAHMHFDLSPMKRESIRLIIDLTLAVVLGSAVFSLAVFFLIRMALVEPLQKLDGIVEAIGRGGEMPADVHFRTREVETLARSVHKACQARRAGEAERGAAT